MQTSEKGLNIIKKFEGFRKNAYQCPAKVWTIGYGTTLYSNTKKVVIGDVISEEKATEELKHFVKKYEDILNKSLKVKLTQGQFDSLISFSYNLGISTLINAPFFKLINVDPNNELITKKMLLYINAGGKPLIGLKNRRVEEVKMYNSN